jgi:hypothetical protein
MFLDLSSALLLVILAAVAYGLSFAFYKLVQDKREFLVLYFLYAFVLLVFVYLLFTAKMQAASSQLFMMVLLVALVSAILAKFSVYWHARLKTLNRQWVWEIAYLVMYFVVIYVALANLLKDQWLWAYA